MQTRSILETKCSILSTNLLTDGCCIGTRGRLLLVTVGQGRRAVWEAPSMLELSVCAHVGSSKLVFAATREVMEVFDFFLFFWLVFEQEKYNLLRH